MKQSSLPPTVKEPQDQLLCSSTARVTPPSSVTAAPNDTLCFITQPFAVNAAITERKVYPAPSAELDRADAGSSGRRAGPSSCRATTSHAGFSRGRPLAPDFSGRILPESNAAVAATLPLLFLIILQTPLRHDTDLRAVSSSVLCRPVCCCMLPPSTRAANTCLQPHMYTVYSITISLRA